MKKIILSIALLSAPLITTANNFSMPGFNNGNGSTWNMPNMNFGNANNGFSNGSNWSMPTMNWGNSNNTPNNGNNLGGNNWNMPTMNWGNGYNNGSSWNMPNMNWGNSFNNNSNGFNNGSNWTIPTMNWGNGNNNYAPNVQYRAPVMPTAPHFTPSAPRATMQTQAPMTKKTVVKAAAPVVKTTPEAKGTVQNEIPMPSEVKGVILAPKNKTMGIETTK